MKWCRFACLLAAMCAVATAVSADEEKKLGWSGSVASGLTITAGTINSVGATLDAEAQRQWETDQIRLNANGIYSENDGDRVANNQQIGGEYRHDFTSRFFGFTSHGFGRDTVQLIQWRYFGEAGPGYRVWEADPEKRYFDTRVGVGYLHTEYLRCCVGFDEDDDDDDPPSRDSTRDDAILTFGFEHANVIAEKLEILHTFTYLLPVTSTDEWIIRTKLTASVPLVLGWAFRNAVELTHENEPSEEADKTNLIYTAGLEYSF